MNKTLKTNVEKVKKSWNGLSDERKRSTKFCLVSFVVGLVLGLLFNKRCKGK